MTKKLLLTFALGAGLAVAATGTAVSVDVGGSLPGTPPPPTAPLPHSQCSDLVDNDGDAKIDLLDPGCTGPTDDNEYNPPGASPPTSGGGNGGGGAGGGGGSGGSGAFGKKKAPKAGGPGLFGKTGVKGSNPKAVAKAETQKLEEPALRNPDGSPSNGNPSLTIAQFGTPRAGVPNFVIDSFEIPPFLLGYFQAYGAEYGVPWQVLAAISKIESDHCRLSDLVSSAGALGCMQFIPSSWKAYGCDANEDGTKDPYNPADSICAAARYLHAAGVEKDLREAIFSYNHADWYVDMVIDQANRYSKLSDDLIGSLTGLTEGAHFPVAANARYADDIKEAEGAERGTMPGAEPNPEAIERRSINIYSRVNAPVVAVKDGVVTAMGDNAKLGKFIVLTDAYGNRYTYSDLGSVAPSIPVPREHALTAKDFKLQGPGDTDPEPSDPASKTADDNASGDQTAAEEAEHASDKAANAEAPVDTDALSTRLFALPDSSAGTDQTSVSGQLNSLLGERVPGYELFKSYANATFKFDRSTMELQPLKVGSKVTGGTVLGEIGEPAAGAPHLNFAIRPAGRGAPKVDPKPILDGWKLIENTEQYRAAGKDPFGDTDATIGQVLLMSKEVLSQRVLADPRIEIYACGRSDIESGGIDRRILATMEYLVERGYRLTVTSLHCGHSFYTSSGNVSAHSSGNAMDIAAINGIPILGHQGPGSITETVVRDLLKLQGTMSPAQIITLMEFGGPTFAMADHDDHIHVGFTPLYGAGKPFDQLAGILKPEQWERLIDRLGQIENPTVRTKPSDASLPAKPPSGGRASDAHTSE